MNTKMNGADQLVILDGSTLTIDQVVCVARDPSIKIVDAQGQTVQTIRGTRTAGMNRVWWNLRTDQSKEVRLRTSPAYAPEIRLNAEGWRTLPEGGRVTILAPPGNYTVKLSVDGQEYSAPLTVVKDPNTGASDEDIQKQTAMLYELRKDLEAAADMTNQIETIRAQLENLKGVLRGNADVRTAADDLDKKLIDIEDNLIQRKYSGQGQDTTRYPTKLIGKITYLAGGVATGDYPSRAARHGLAASGSPFDQELADPRQVIVQPSGQPTVAAASAGRHVDPAFYDHYYDGSTVTPAIRRHMQDWHS